MKHKLWLIMLAFVSTLCLTFGLSACGGEGGGTNHVHEPIRHEAQEPTCTEDGNELYFECKKCHALFLDESCTEKTTLAAVQKQATGHKARSEWEQGEATHYHVCDVCGEKLSDTESAHDFGTAWESDENGHWQICAICGKKGNEAPHDFGTGNVCTTCNYTEKAPSEGLRYKLNNDQVSYSVVWLGSCTDNDIVIPSTYEDLPVTSIGYEAFWGRSELTSIKIPDSVISIGAGAFENCSGLTSVTIGSGVTSIEYDAFADCRGLTSIKIPDSVTSIGSCAFYECSGLTSVTIGSGVTSIGNSTFYGTAYYNDNSNWDESGVLYIGNYLIEAQETISGSYTIRANTKVIAVSAFYNCSGLTSIEIPDSVTSIGNQAFYNCSRLTGELKIPDSVTSIGNQAFVDCSGLESVTIGKGVTSIERGTFGYCRGLKSVTIESGVTSIEFEAFCNCSGLTSITVPDSVTTIGFEAFVDCSGLESVTIGSGVTSIGSSAFMGCSRLEEFIVDERNNAYSNQNGILYNKEKTEIIRVPCMIKEITIPDSVTSIEDLAFEDCSGLTNIEIPDSVTSIGSCAFGGCSGLESVTIGSSVTSIGGGAFGGCSGLESVTIGSSVNSIGNQAFSGCSGLTNITIPDSVNSIGEGAFAGCSGLESVTIGNGVTSIGKGAFADCSGLESVTIGSVTSIGEGAFDGCSGLEEVHITDLAAWCRIDFNDDDSNPLYYAHHLYLDGAEIKNLTIPSEITEIKQYAFEYCSGLESVTIGSSVTSIGGGAFTYCTGLKAVYYKGTAEEWGNISIVGTYIYGNNYYLTSATRYYFTENTPTAEEWASYDYWWHYDPATSLPTPWVKDQ